MRVKLHRFVPLYAHTQAAISRVLSLYVASRIVVCVALKMVQICAFSALTEALSACNIALGIVVCSCMWTNQCFEKFFWHNSVRQWFFSFMYYIYILQWIIFLRNSIFVNVKLYWNATILMNIGRYQKLVAMKVNICKVFLIKQHVNTALLNSVNCRKSQKN